MGKRPLTAWGDVAPASFALELSLAIPFTGVPEARDIRGFQSMDGHAIFLYNVFTQIHLTCDYSLTCSMQEATYASESDLQRCDDDRCSEWAAVMSKSQKLRVHDVHDPRRRSP